MEKEKQEKKQFIELLVSALEPGGFQEELRSEIGIQFLNLKKTHSENLDRLKKEFDGVSRTYFNKLSLVSKTESRVSEMVDSLKRIARNITPEGSEVINHSSLKNNHVKAVYEYYKKAQGHVPDMPLKKIILSESDLIKLDSILTEFGKEALKLKLFREISDQLTFIEFYSMNERKVVNKTADACWDLYNQITDNGRNSSGLDITRDEFRESIFQEYHIRHYRHLSNKEARKKISNTVAQWTRDVRKTNQIHIKK